MSQIPLTQQMIDTPVDNGTEKRGLYATASRHPLVTGGLVLVGAGLAYAVGRLVTASRDGEIARDVHVEASGERGDNAMEKPRTDQQPGQPQDPRFEKAKTGAVAVTGNVEQGPPQQQSSPRDHWNKPASATTAGEEAEGQERTTRAA